MDNLDDVWGNPYNFKNINIYPIKMKDCNNFYEYVTCLTIDKNKIQDIQILRMSYLRFLFFIGLYARDDNDDNFQYLIEKLEKLLNLVFRNNVNFYFEEEKIFILVDDIKLNEVHFDKIRKIILKQNLIPINEDNLDPEIERALKEAEEFLSARNNSPTLEETIVSYHIATGIPYREIKNLTIYQFKKGIERLDLMKTWEVYTYPALKSGESEKIKHWLSHIPEKSIYDGLVMSMEDFDKMTSNSGIFKK